MDETQHGVILNDGTRIPYSQLKESDPLLYKQYVEGVAQPGAQLNQTQTSTQATGAEIPGIQASSNIKTIQAQQTASPLNLKKDLTGGMTLKGALSKYTALGMSADDVFKNYLSQSPHGLPIESPTQLQNMGIKPETLGKIGENGSFQDRWNTRNAIEGARALKKQFNGVNTVSKLPFLGDATPTGQAYDSARQIFGEHLSSLIPGGSNASGDVKALLDTIPGVGDTKALEPGAAEGKFNAIENQLLNAKGYTYSDLGLSAPKETTQSSNGHDLLKTLLSSAGGGKDDASGHGGKPGRAALDLVTGKGTKQAMTDMYGATPEDVSTNVKKYAHDFGPEGFNKAMVGVASTELGFGTLAKLFGGGSKIAEATLADAPGGVKQLLQPKKSKVLIGAIRDNILKAADKVEGNTISGDKVIQTIRSWADSAKLSNIPDSTAIEEAAVNAENSYKGKVFKPSELADIYKKIENGYTTNGLPRSSTASYIDRGLKGILSDILDKSAPGFKKTSEIFDKVYKGEKSEGGKFVKKLPSTVAKAGINAAANAAGLGALKSVLGL